LLNTVDKPIKIGSIASDVVSILGIDTTNINKPILLGDSNITHIKNRHPEDFDDFGDKIEEILSNPTYIGIHPKQGSLEYIKEFKLEDSIVLCAVRLSKKGTYFVRSLYTITQEKLDSYIDSNSTKPYKK